MSDYKERFRERFGRIIKDGSDGNKYDITNSVLGFIDEQKGESEAVGEERGYRWGRNAEKQRIVELIEKTKYNGPYQTDLVRGRNRGLQDLLSKIQSPQHTYLVDADMDRRQEKIQSEEKCDCGKEVTGQLWHTKKRHKSGIQEDGFKIADETLKHGYIGPLQEETKCPCGCHLFGIPEGGKVCFTDRTHPSPQEETECCRDKGQGWAINSVGDCKCPCHKPRTEETDCNCTCHNGPETNPQLIFCDHCNPKETEKEGASFSGRDEEIARMVDKLRAPSNWLKQPRGKDWKSVVNEYDRTPFQAADLLESFPKETTTPQDVTYATPLPHEPATTTPQSREQSTGGEECLAFIPGGGGGAVCTRKKPCCVHGEKTNQ